MQVTLTMSKEEFDEYQAKISEYHATLISNDKLRAYSEKLERDVAEFREALDKIAPYLYLSPYDNFISISADGFKAIRELFGLENFEESINESVNTSNESVNTSNESVNTSNESISEPDQVGSESSSD